MKKHLYAILALFVMAGSAQAQKKLTEKDLLGKWNVTEIQMSLGIVDFKNEKFIPSESTKDEMDAESIEMMQDLLFESIGFMADYYFNFTKGYNVDTNIEGVSEQGYKLIEKNGKQYMTSAEGDDDEVEIYIKDKKLYFIVPDEESGEEIKMLFVKQS